MAQEGRPLPAWRRLGLELTTGDQPDHISQNTKQQPGQSRSASRAARKDHSPAVEATQKGQSSTLGKRGIAESPAEEHGQTRKKSRTDAEPAHLDEPVQTGVLASTKRENGAPEPKLNDPDKSRPKGDPNYRKKKGKQGTNRPVKSSQHHEADALQARTIRDSSSLQHHGQRARRRSPTASPSPSDLANATEEAGLLPSTETDLADPPTNITPQTKKKKKALARASTDLDSSPARADRRKSVTFTPDTKTSDGTSASNLFKKWVTEQKGPAAEFSPAEVAQFAPPPKVHPANNVTPSQPQNVEKAQQPNKAEKRSKKVKEQKTATGSESVSVSKQRKESPALSGVQPHKPAESHNQRRRDKDKSLYLGYLKQYHTDRSSWKFSKVRQNDVLGNALNVFRIPEEYSDALLAYVRGLKGAGTIDRLKERCNSTLKELAESDSTSENMDDASARRLAQEEALGERLEKEKKRRQTEADIETLTGHPHPNGFVRRLERNRAEALLAALNMATPITPSRATNSASANVRSPASMTEAMPSQKVPRKRKSRTEVSSDESSSDSSGVSSSSEDSSSEEESDENDEDPGASSSGSDGGSSEEDDQSSSDGEEEGGSDDSSGFNIDDESN